MKLRSYQTELIDGIHQAWSAGHRNVAAVLPTGGGKTVLFSSILADERAPSCAIAHRQELVSQMSLTLCRFGIQHGIIAARSTVKNIIAMQIQEHGRSVYDPMAACRVASAQTLVRRKPDTWTRAVRLWVLDETHHLLAGNQWGKTVRLFPSARGLGVTATPTRADGNGLGRHADGLLDTMVVGPSMRELIDQGYLTDYRIFAPRVSDLDLDDVPISQTTGDYSKPKLVTAVKHSRIVGDVVTHYCRLAAGKRGVTFATDIETATTIAERYNLAGIPAEIVSAKTPDRERLAVIRRFRAGHLLQLVNVDLFGEGFDLPAIEVVSMARPTASYGLYCQQFGRALRPMDGKQHAIIIDHVGNVIRHGLPDAPREWTLDRRERRAASTGPPTLKACPTCTGVYERFYVSCPYCGYEPEISPRARPEEVDGDLYELDAATLAQMRGEADRLTEPFNRHAMEAAGAPRHVINGAAAQHRRRAEAQGVLRDTMAWWAGHQQAAGRSDRESWRLFYHRFGVDMITAQTLGRPDAERLTRRVRDDYEE